MSFFCPSCGDQQPPGRPVCGGCGSFVEYQASENDLRAAINGETTAALPSSGVSSMGEGETPLINLPKPRNVLGKLESLNPTCSFKDRGSAVIISAVIDPNTTFEGVVVASTGNTATSVAGYAARANVPCTVLVPEGTSTAKLAQAATHEADVFVVEGTFSDCFELAQAVAEDDRIINSTAVYSANSFVAAANRAVAFELVATLGEVPDWVSVPVGAGPLLGGMYQGFRELRDASLVTRMPRMLCVQAQGCHPIVQAIERGNPVEVWDKPIETDVGAIADPLRGYAADGQHTKEAVLDSDGAAISLADETVKVWHDRLAAESGVYAEPASAASVGAAVECSSVADDETVVSLITGHGLKEPAESSVRPDPAPSMTAIRSALVD